MVGFVLLLFCVVLQKLFRSEIAPARDDLIGSGLLYLVTVIFAVANWRLVLPLFGFRGWYFLPLALAMAPLTVALAYLQLLVFPGLEKYWINYSQDFLAEGFGWDVIFLTVAVGPALFEELFFRGVMLHRLLKIMTPWQAIFVTAMAFAILHFTAIGIVFYLLPLAVLAGWLTLRSQSLWPAIFLHLAHNGCIVYFEYLELP